MFIVVSNNISASFVDVVQPKLMGLVVVYAITQMLDNYIFQPTIFSNSIHAHPLEIFLVILIAGTLGGIIGMVIAIPLYAFMRIVFIEMNREFGFIERLKAR
jgi:predicted PurR-regulated permease PerM